MKTLYHKIMCYFKGHSWMAARAFKVNLQAHVPLYLCRNCHKEIDEFSRLFPIISETVLDREEV